MIAGAFRRLPIRRKLVAMILGTSAAVLLVASLGYLFADYYRSRVDLQRDLTSQAQLVAENLQAAIQFDDPAAIEDTLHTLGPNTHVKTACVYKEDKLVGAFRPHADSRPCPEQPGPDTAVFTRDRLQLTAPIMLKGERAGTVLLRSDLELISSRLRIQGIVVAILLAITLGVALILSSWLQSLVSDPVTALARTAAEVSARGDYSLRARRSTDDELGLLVEAFNQMLGQIQQREAELSKTNDELRREVAERRRAEQQRAELLVREQEANRLKDEFLATLSHELRTPLNAILGWTKLLRANAVPPAGMDRALEKVERNAQVQSRLVEDLLEVSRIVSGKMRLEVRPLDLLVLVTTAIESIRPTAEARGVLLERVGDRAPMPTSGDPDRIQQVIWNLLSNAVKFTPSGGAVRIRLRRAGAVDEIVVSDTGIGIQPEFLPNVFDTFRQADASATRSHGGLGLGLSIVRRLVELHGGDVRAESGGPDTGSTFTVRLPVRTVVREVASDPAAGLGGSHELAGVRIVAVDDDLDTRDLLVSVLESAGAAVRVAASADEGFAACMELRPQVLVSDIAMPSRDGHALMRELQATLGPDAPRVRIALTAFATPGDQERSAAAGYQRHIAKPVDPVMLVATIRAMLQSVSPHA